MNTLLKKKQWTFWFDVVTRTIAIVFFLGVFIYLVIYWSNRWESYLSARKRVPQNWVSIGSTPTERVEVNVSSISKSYDVGRGGYMRHAHVRITHAAGDWQEFFESFKCDSRGFRQFLERDRAHPGGYIAFVGNIDPPFQAVSPGSLEETALNYVCGYHLD